MALQRSKRRSFQAQNRQSAIAIDDTANQQKNSLLTALGKFSEAGAATYSAAQQVEIEASKAEGAARAAEDLLVAEDHRQGTTEKDNLAKKIAYNSIVGQNDTMNAGNDFAAWYASNPDATEDEIGDKKQELYLPVLEKYGEDKQSLKQVSLQVQESQFKLTGVQDTIKQRHTKAKNNEALGISLENFLSDPKADIDNIVDNDLPAQAKSLGLTEFELKNSLVGTASKRAAEGDNRLLEKLQTLGWSKDSAAVAKAQGSYDDFVNKEQSVNRGNAMGQLELENLSLAVPWSTTLRKIKNMNKINKDTYSDVRVASLLKARNAAVAAAAKKRAGIKSSFKRRYDKNAWPFGSDPDYTPQERKGVVKDLMAYWSNKSQELQAADVPADQAKTQILKEQLDWSRDARYVVPNLKDAIGVSVNLPLDEITNGEIPQYAQAGFDTMKLMDATAIDLYVGSANKAFVNNFKYFAKFTETDEQAYRKAMQIKQNPFSVSTEQKTEQRETTVTDAKERLYNTVWETITFQDTDVRNDVPDWNVNLLANRWSSDAELNLYSGGVDVDSNSNQAIDVGMSRMTQLNNGTLANQNAVDLHRNISNGRDMQADKVTSYVESHMTKLAPALSKAYGQEINMDDMLLDFSREGDTFTVMLRGDTQVAGIFLTSSIYESGVASELELNKASQEEGKQRAEGRKAARVVTDAANAQLEKFGR